MGITNGNASNRFTEQESAAIQWARERCPKMRLRTLARMIHDNPAEPIGEHLMYRTFNSIYSALRRYEASRLAVPAGAASHSSIAPLCRAA